MTLSLIGMLTLAFNIQPVKSNGTIYIRADGGVDPPTAPIQRDGYTYTFTDNIYENSIVIERDNIVLDGNGYTLEGSVSLDLYYGIDLSGRSNVTIKKMKITNFEYGIRLHNSSKCRLISNNIIHNHNAIHLTDSSNNNIIAGNNIYVFSAAIWFNSSSNNIVYSNNIDSGYEGIYGLFLKDSHNNSIYDNTIRGILEVGGITLLQSSYNNLYGNTITDGHGLWLWDSSNNLIIQNNVNLTAPDWLYGSFQLSNSSSNIIYHNNFVMNADQIYSFESVNIWDNSYPSGGNFWSNYTGIDEFSGPDQDVLGSDGIGDTPYVIDADNQDRYPLMNPWTPTPLPKFQDEWTMFQHDERNTGHSLDTTIYPPLTKIWEFDAKNYISAPPVASFEAVYVVRRDGIVYKLNAVNGTTIWEKGVGYWVDESLALGQGSVFVSLANGTLCALDQNTGEIKWMFNAGWTVSAATYADGTVYIGSSRNVYAIYASNGSEKWRFATDGWIDTPAVSKGIVYIGSADGRAYAINANSGTEKWRFPSVGYLHTIVGSPMVGEGIIYVPSDKLYALNASNGEELWSVGQTGTGSVVFESWAFAYNSVLRASYSQVNAFDATTGILRWNYTSTERGDFSGVIVANNIVYAGLGGQSPPPYRLVALDAFDGSLVWQYAADFPLRPIIANGRLYATSLFHGNRTYSFAPVAIPNFLIAASPASLTIQQGSSDTSAITITSVGGFNQLVQLTVTGEPSGVTTALNPEQVTPPADGSATSTLIVSVDSTATAGSYTLTVTGTSNSLIHSVDISLEITPTPTLVSGKDVPAEAPDFFPSVLTKLNIPTTEFAVQALTTWTNYENTNAYWNPLATTWDMGDKSWNFNEAGVKNYADKETGIQATANTLALHYYESIREMLAIQSFNEQHLREAVATWSGLNPGDSYVINLVNEWRNIYPLSADQPPTCVIKLQKDGVEMHEVERAEFFDIYVGDSTDDTGIKQVHFSSDDVQDNNPTGRWTEWHDWDTSSGDWDASIRIKRWAFATPGYKELWAEVIDDVGQTAICSAAIFVPAPALPVITSPLVITPVKDVYCVGDSLEAEFTIKNIGDVPITLDVLTVGGRLNGWIPVEGAPDFTFQSVTLQPDESHQYRGNLMLTQQGNYRFFVAYHIENPTPEEKRLLDENNWNTCIELGEGLTHIDRVRNIIVFEEGTVPEEVNALREQIDRLKKQHVSYPPYLLEADSWESAVSTLWADFTSFVTRIDLREKYDELYQTGFTYQWFRIRALIDTGNFLDRGDMANAKKYLQKSYKYDKLSWMSFGAAAQVFDGNMAAGQVLAEGIRDGCEAATRFGIAVVWPAAAVKVDAFYMGINWVLNTELEGWEQATIDLVIDIAFTAIFKMVQFKNLDYNTLENYVNRVGTNVPLDTLLGNKEFMAEFGIELKKVIIDRIEEGITEEVIEKIVEETLRYYESMKDSVQIKTKSPVELRVVDSKGQITGLVHNKVKHEISMSLYYNETVTILFTADTYHYEVVGTDEGTYGLEITSVRAGNVTAFTATDIPTSANAIHQYTIDWDALSLGEEGVTVKVDSDGDGFFEKTIIADNELTQDEFMVQVKTFDVFWEDINYPVVVSSNSTVTQFTFNQSLAQIEFKVSSETDTTGYCNVTIPKPLLRGNPWTITIDTTPITFIQADNATHSFLYFNYTHGSTRHVIIKGTWVIPEFPTAIILPLFMVISIIAIILAKRKIPRRMKKHSKHHFSNVLF